MMRSQKKRKNNFSRISRRCLTLNRFALLALGLVSAEASIPKHSISTIESNLRSDLVALHREKKTDFHALIEKWDRVYGKTSTPALLKISQDPKTSNSDRYVAILAHTKFSGPHDAKELVALLQDRDWMVRSAALKSIEILGYTPASSHVLKILAHDPALVIRLQAIETLLKLRPPKLPAALLAAASDGKNYRPADFRRGRADWVPERALAALRELKPNRFAAHLVPLMNEAKDGRIRAHALHTIEILESKSLKQGRPFQERAKAWTETLQASR